MATKKKQINPPKDLDLSDRKFKLMLSIYDYPYDKGSDARFIIGGKLTRGEELHSEEDWGYFEPGTKMTCEFQDWICGFNSKKMKELAKWATKAAKYLQQQERRTGFGRNDDEEEEEDFKL